MKRSEFFKRILGAAVAGKVASETKLETPIKCGQQTLIDRKVMVYGCYRPDAFEKKNTDRVIKVYG